MDPIDGNIFDPITLHKYLYANANPANNLDPSGLFTLAESNLVVAIIQILYVGFVGFNLSKGLLNRNTPARTNQFTLKIEFGVSISGFGIVAAGIKFASIEEEDPSNGPKLDDRQIGIFALTQVGLSGSKNVFKNSPPFAVTLSGDPIKFKTLENKSLKDFQGSVGFASFFDRSKGFGCAGLDITLPGEIELPRDVINSSNPCISGGISNPSFTFVDLGTVFWFLVFAKRALD